VTIDIYDEAEDTLVVPGIIATKKDLTADLLTIMSDRCIVKFRHKNGDMETKTGRWCKVCK
jgi:hypothetical protein